jgi:hypothetical protein
MILRIFNNSQVNGHALLTLVTADGTFAGYTIITNAKVLDELQKVNPKSFEFKTQVEAV